MPNWKYKLRIKDLLSDSEDQTLAAPVGRNIALRIKRFSTRNTEFKDDYGLDNIVECLDSINTVESWVDLCEDDSTWIPTPPISELNGWLSELYDWCDNNSVWVE